MFQKGAAWSVESSFECWKSVYVDTILMIYWVISEYNERVIGISTVVFVCELDI